MARILIGWEIGGGQGHVVRVKRHRQALEAAGHDVVVALRRWAPEMPDALQAPIWSRRPVQAISTASLGDVLVNMGAAVPGAFRETVDGWREMVDRIRPDRIVADFAPALLTAARGTVKTILIGNGYDCPPSDMAEFPPLVPGAVPYDERPAADAMGLPTMPAAFAADHVVVGALPWMDPYGESRMGTHLPPFPEAPLGGGGDEVFVYVTKGRTTALDDALAKCGLPVREYEHGRPTPWTDIAARSAIVVSHGGCGFVTQAALCGIPQILLTPDLEKQFYGMAVEKAGVGRAMASARVEPAMLGAAIRRMARDGSARRRCAREAGRLRGLISKDPIARVVELCS